jgi:opacity protein-like surface antigen
MEYTFRDFASLRAGQRFEHDLGGMSVGGGVQFKLNETYKARIDYGYQDFDALSEIHRIAMTVDF